MEIEKILNDNSIKRIEKRNSIISSIFEGKINFKEIDNAIKDLSVKDISIVLEAIEDISRNKNFVMEEEYLHLAEKFILSNDNSCKREASRIIGNLVEKFPNVLNETIEAILINTKDCGTVIRWASAYALAKIIIIPQYSKSSLFQQVKRICEDETENGVKNQYIKALKKAEKIRNS